MIATALNWLLPDDLWSWVAVVALVLLVAAAWLVPGIKTVWRIVITGTLIAVAIIAAQHSLWQDEVDDHAVTKADLNAKSAALDAERKQRLVLEREAAQRVNDEQAIGKATTELKDAINEAAKQPAQPGAVHPAIRAVDCGRMRREGKTGTARYRDLGC